MYCQGKSSKRSVCAAANAEPVSVILTQAKFPIDGGLQDQVSIYHHKHVLIKDLKNITS